MGVIGDNRTGTKWTDEETGTLLIAHDEGKTFGQIARLLPGRTRNMVAGKMHRLGLCTEKPKGDMR